LLIIATVWLWIAFGGPYNAITYTRTDRPVIVADEDSKPLTLDEMAANPRKRIEELDFSEPHQHEWTEVSYCFKGYGHRRFTETLQAWITLLVPGGITIYLLKTHK